MFQYLRLKRRLDKQRNIQWRKSRHRRRKNHFCQMSHHIKLPPFMQDAIGVSCRGKSFFLVETNTNIIEQRWSIAARVILDILPDPGCFLYNVSLSANYVSLSKHVFVLSGTSVPTCVVHALSNAPDSSHENHFDDTVCLRRACDYK